MLIHYELNERDQLMETNTSLQDVNIFLRHMFGSVSTVPTNEVKHCDSLICELELICKLDL